MITTVSNEDRNEFGKHIKKLGAAFCNDLKFQSNTTHVVCGKLSRSEKFLGALILGRWVVRPQYITASLRAGKWLDEVDYEWSSLEAGHDQTLAVAAKRNRWRASNSTEKIFTDWQAAVALSDAKRQSVYKRLLVLGGAKVCDVKLPVKDPFKYSDCLTYLFVDETTAPLTQSLQDMGVMCLCADYISDFIVLHPSPDPMDYLQLVNAGHQPPNNSPHLGPGQSADRSITLGGSGCENASTATRDSTAVDQNHRDDEMLVFSQVPSQRASALRLAGGDTEDEMLVFSQVQSQKASALRSAGGDTEDEMLVLSQCPSAQKSYSATSNDDSELEVLDQTEFRAKTPEVIDISTDDDEIIFVSDSCTSAGSTSTAGVNGRVDDWAIFQFDSKRTPSGCAKKSPQKTGTGDRTALVKSELSSPKRKRPAAAVGSSPSKGKKARTPTKSCREVSAENGDLWLTLDADSDQLMLISGTTGRGTKGGQSATVTSAKCTETSSVATTSSTPSKSATSSYTKRTSASATKSKSLICSSSLSSASSLSSVWPTAATPSKPAASSHPPSTPAAAASATKSKSSACSSSSSRLSSSQPTNFVVKSKAFAHASSQLSSSQPANSASKSKTSARSSSRLSSSQPTNSAAKSKNPARSSSSSLISSSQPASSRKRKAKDDDDDSDCVITVWDHKKELERMSRDVTKDPTKQSLVSTSAKKVQRSLRDWFSSSGKENDGTEVLTKELNAMSKVKRESAKQFQSKSDNLQKRTAEQNLVLSKQSVTECTKQSTTKSTVVLQQLALEDHASSSTSSVHKPERASQSISQKKCTPVSASQVSMQKQCAPRCEPDTTVQKQTVAVCVQEQSSSDVVAEVAMQEETSADVAPLVSVKRRTAPESTSHLLEQIAPRKDSALGASPSNKPRTESNKSSVACVEGVSGLGTSQSLSSVDTATLPIPAALAGVSDPLPLRHPVSTRVTPVNSSVKRIRNSRGKPHAVLSPRPQNNTRIGRRTRNQTDRMSKFLATVSRKRKTSNQVPDKAENTSEAGSPLKLETKTVPAKRVKTVRGLSRKLAVENLLQNSEPDSNVEKTKSAIATVSNLVQEISTTASEVRQRNSNPASSMEKRVSGNALISVSRQKEIKDSSAFSPGEMGWRTIPESLNQIMSGCVDDSDFQSAICTVMSVRTSSPSVEMVKHLVTVIKKADKVNLVDQGLAVLNAWLDKYPPVTPGLRTVYEKGLALDSWETFRTILQDAVCEAEVEEDLDDSKSASGPRALLILRIVVKALEKNFHQFMQNASRQGRIQCLVIRSLWSPSYQVYPNGRTRDLLLFLETALKHLDTPQSCWQELVKLVSMATQCCHLVDNNWQYTAGGLVDRCSSAMVRDLTQAISGGGISSSRQLQQVLSCVSPPWLLRQVSAVLLEEYDDYLVPGGLTSGPVTLQNIVSKFFFLLPKLSAQSKSVNVSPRKKVKKEDSVKDENKAPPAGLTADKINKKNHKGETMLHRAAIKNNISLLKQLLSVPGVDVNAQDYAGWTPLHEACNHGNTECARALLKFVPCATLHSFFQSGKRGKLRKVDLTLANEEGITALHDAVMSNQIAVVKLLLKYRGSSLLTAKTTLGCTPLDVATTEEMRQVLNRDSLDASLSLDFSLSQESFTQDMDSKERESVPSSFMYREVLDSSAIPDNNSGPGSSTSSGTQLSALLEESRRFLTLLTFLLTSHIQVQKQERRMQQKRQEQQEEKQQQGQKQAEDFEERELKFHAQSLRRHMKKITTEEVFNGLTLQLTLIETLLVNCGAH
ncbi:hypothetical protein V1264_023978 [Littorina saxatilis]|uniref:BRCT domain-containing protein n=2 Tax=Littorina saxatilis TaxID=31220 RepID=A0AAN9BCV3_9CAEN